MSRYTPLEVVPLKRYSLEQHVEDVRRVYWEIHIGSGGKYEDALRTIWFTAYERWLNNRLLMSEEDAH